METLQSNCKNAERTLIDFRARKTHRVLPIRVSASENLGIYASPEPKPKRVTFHLILTYFLALVAFILHAGSASGQNANAAQHAVFWTHDGWFPPASRQQDFYYTNVASISYGSKVDV